MAIFRKNPNEVVYTEGKKHWTDVIKNTGAGEYIIWRQPEEDFNTNSTLIVMPGEEAIFVKGGVIEEVFENGTYKLSTENYPFISRLRNAFSGGISTFNCVVYFVRKTTSKEILWGTSSPIQVRDKKLGIASELRSNGSYRIQIDNPAIFLEKLIGNNVPFQTETDLNLYFHNTFQSKIRSVITGALNETNTELLGIEARIDEFSETIQPFLNNALEEFGLRCANFSISKLVVKDDELRRKYDEIEIEAHGTVRRAEAETQGIKIGLDGLGPDYFKVQGIEILKTVASNPGAGGIAAAGAGLGMGLGTAGVIGTIAQGVFSEGIPSQSGNTLPQSPPAPPQPRGRFTQQPAAAREGSHDESAPRTSTEERLDKIKDLLDKGYLTKEEYDKKRAEIINSV